MRKVIAGVTFVGALLAAAAAGNAAAKGGYFGVQVFQDGQGHVTCVMDANDPNAHPSHSGKSILHSMQGGVVEGTDLRYSCMITGPNPDYAPSDGEQP